MQKKDNVFSQRVYSVLQQKKITPAGGKVTNIHRRPGTQLMSQERNLDQVEVSL
jgi:hypothetical protein